MKELQTILKNECGLCGSCVKIYVGTSYEHALNSSDKTNNSSCCPLCLGLLCNYEAQYKEQIAAKIKEKIKPYSGSGDQSVINFISNTSPTIVLPNIILVVAHCVNCKIEDTIRQKESNNDEIDSLTNRYQQKKVQDVFNDVKEVLRKRIRQLIININKELNQNCEKQSVSLSNDLHGEEAGYLKFHFAFTPSLTFPHLPYQEANQNYFPLPLPSTKRDRKRFRGCDPVAKQGGDPRTNLNSHVKIHLSSLLEKHDSIIQKITEEKISSLQNSINCCFLERNVLVKHLETIGSSDDMKHRFSNWFEDMISFSTDSIRDVLNQELDTLGIFVSCWRNHFYLKGKYTKSRRDVSQTPFYVNDNENYDDIKFSDADLNNSTGNNKNERIPNQMKRLGISSVDEEICPVIAKFCNGMSSDNNEPTHPTVSKSAYSLVYGLCKFHASGREDMDVRMILPIDAKSDPIDVSNKMGSGRPFVCEIIDAYKLPSLHDLNIAVQTINQNSDSCSDYKPLSVLEKVTGPGDNKWVIENPKSHVQYGLNPHGVGVSGLAFCRSSCYSTLQSETEDKVKFYGCLCWSHNIIPHQESLEQKLKTGAGCEGTYPLQIEQSTPLRVLHRRSAGVRIRHVLSLTAHRIDDHFFRLHLSTSAGTYVKVCKVIDSSRFISCNIFSTFFC